MGSARSRVTAGMEVAAVDDVLVGRVTVVHASTFRVIRPVGPDVDVPFRAMQSVDDGRVVIDRRASEFDDAGWAVASGAQTPLGASPLHGGMAVLDRDRRPVGTVTQGADRYVRVSRPHDTDLYVPRSGALRPETAACRPGDGGRDLRRPAAG